MRFAERQHDQYGQLPAVSLQHYPYVQDPMAILQHQAAASTTAVSQHLGQLPLQSQLAQGALGETLHRSNSQLRQAFPPRGRAL